MHQDSLARLSRGGGCAIIGLQRYALFSALWISAKEEEEGGRVSVPMRRADVIRFRTIGGWRPDRWRELFGALLDAGWIEMRGELAVLSENGRDGESFAERECRKLRSLRPGARGYREDVDEDAAMAAIEENERVEAEWRAARGGVDDGDE